MTERKELFAGKMANSKSQSSSSSFTSPPSTDSGGQQCTSDDFIALPHICEIYDVSGFFLAKTKFPGRGLFMAWNFRH